MKDSLTIAEIIERAGGLEAVAEAAHVSVETVIKWRRRGVMDKYWPVLIRLAGVTADDLLLANQAARGGVASVVGK